jgi:hypothetical protein
MLYPSGLNEILRVSQFFEFLLERVPVSSPIPAQSRREPCLSLMITISPFENILNILPTDEGKKVEPPPPITMKWPFEDILTISPLYQKQVAPPPSAPMKSPLKDIVRIPPQAPPPSIGSYEITIKGYPEYSTTNRTLTVNSSWNALHSNSVTK